METNRERVGYYSFIEFEYDYEFDVILIKGNDMELEDRKDNWEFKKQ